MTPQQLAALAKDNLFAFPKLVSNLQCPKHIKFIADKVQEKINQEGKKFKLLMISVPPRSGKSLLISKHAVPWYLGKFPDKRVILTSYSSDLSDQNSDFAKDIFEQWGPILWDSHPSKSLFNRSMWNTSKGGGCVSAGICGQITGFGADLFIIDDFFKGNDEAESKNHRDELWDKWQSIISTRLHPGSTVVILSTRWSDDDLVGRLLKQAKEQKDTFPFDYEYVNLPAIALRDDPLGRQPGEALWPDRFPIEMLNDIRNIVGSYWWNSLYQGMPVNKGGTLFKYEDFRYFEQQGSSFICYRTDEESLRIDKSYIKTTVILDPAIEKKRKNDPSNMLAWGYSSKHKIWLLFDRLNDRIDHKKLRATALSFAAKNNATRILVENEKLGKVLQRQSEGNDEINGIKIPFKEVRTKGVDKYARAVPMATYIENQRVFFPKNVPWLATYEGNLTSFPGGAEDEDVDCTAYAKELEKSISLTEVLGR